MQIDHNNISWINLSNPKANDLEFLGTELRVSPLVLKQLLGFNKRPKIEEYDSYLFIVMHFPVFNRKSRQTISAELDFIVSREKIITIFQNDNPALSQIWKEMSANENIRQMYFKSSGFLLFSILDKLIDSCLPMLDHINEKIEEIEDKVFDGKEREMLKEIAIVKRDIIDFRRTIKPQRSVLEILAKKIGRFFHDESLDIISQEVIGSEIRVWNTLENHKEMIEAIEKTNESLLSYQINRVMHTLTFFSIVLFSLTFIAGFFSMHPMESSNSSNGLFIAAGTMILSVLVITAIFKTRKWM
jgi:magnesium transporter